ncbi:iron-siderophore ABC transporter substrate-binding protein [Amycolatopsis thermophila]|uniref:Iron complex transport system substrate-binding protein n=1 Tax=Amycolatopsis thermophila TaxID=206084 RepID=A0ABU0ELU8_9PSEU|nr:iron-siderophore ABC transporter substrate-binding protein [Amycolatopsis thermophila]MDQ0376259.1 iron complex transport system substrate-binding protein [Amycolatopsis thermophila]
MRSPRPRARGSLPALLLGAVLALAGCGSSAEQSATEPATPASGRFPVTIATAFGDVTIPAQPKRVVALGWGDAEVALTLGVQPVGASDWLPVGGDGVAPWMPQDKHYTTAPTMLGTLEVSAEQVAALDPDLILDTRAGGDKARYDQLAALGVPVVGIPAGGEAYATTWQQQLDMIGKALGRTSEAAKVQSDLDAKFQQAAGAHPEFTGKSVAVGAKMAGSYGAYVNGGARIEFMERLGFTQSPQVQAQANDSFYITVSPERMDLFNADLTVISPIGVSADEITKDPLFQAVPSVKAGHVVVLSDQTVSQAFASATPLGLSYAIDQVVPMITEAMAR